MTTEDLTVRYPLSALVKAKRQGYALNAILDLVANPTELVDCE